MKTLVLGIGNTLLTDEGIGIHVLHGLGKRASAPGSQDPSRPPWGPGQSGDGPAIDLGVGVELLDGGTLSFKLAGPIATADALIVVDAANLCEAPGTLRVFEGSAMDDFLMHNRKSTVHEVGLTELRAIALLAGHWPARRALVAIQPEVVDWGETPTPAVAAAIEPACAAVRRLIAEWRAA